MSQNADVQIGSCVRVIVGCDGMQPDGHDQYGSLWKTFSVNSHEIGVVIGKESVDLRSQTFVFDVMWPRGVARMKNIDIVRIMDDG